jgi:hypothetical protein
MKGGLLDILKSIEGMECSPVTRETFTEVQRQLEFVYDQRKRTQNFFPLPVGLRRKDLEKISSSPYVCSPKADGIRVLLFLTSLPHPCAFLVTRSMECVSIRLEADSRAYRYHGTVLDCEMVVREKAFLYVFDSLRCYSCDMRNQNYMLRLNAAMQIVNSTKIGGIRFEMKTVFAINDFEKMIQRKESIMEDGIIFTAVNEPFPRSATCFTTFKYKPVPTVDLYLHKTGRPLWGTEYGMDDVQMPPGLGLKIRKRGLEAMEGKVCEFSVNNIDDYIVLSFVRCRYPEKTTPNFYRTVEGVFGEAREKITIQEISGALCKDQHEELPEVAIVEESKSLKEASHPAKPKRKREDKNSRKKIRHFQIYVSQEHLSNRPMKRLFD